MSNKNNIPQVQAPSKAEIEARRQQIFMQKRETFALNALNKLIEQKKIKYSSDIDEVVDTAVKIADRLLIALYSVEADEGTETDANKADK